MSQNFAALQKAIQTSPEPVATTRLLSISFDPEFDTPEVLKQYAQHAGADPAIWTFATGDVQAVPLERADFVYADPPYDVEFTHYSKGGFSWDDQERTAVWLAKHRGPVVLVNQRTERVNAVQAGIHRRFPRRAAASAARVTACRLADHRHAQPVTPRRTTSGGDRQVAKKRRTSSRSVVIGAGGIDDRKRRP
jgi:hypothetical protein